MAALINLITDFGEDYRAIVKREIFKRNPSATVIDHGQIADYNIWKTAHVLDVAYERTIAPFPEIFLCITDPGVGTPREHLVATTRDGKYFVGPNNGIVTYIRDRIEHAGIVNLSLIGREKYSNTFHGRDIFGPTAALLSLGKTLDEVADELDINRVVVLPVTVPEPTKFWIERAQVRYADNYGDIIFNVPRELLQEITHIEAYEKEWPLKQTYADVPVGQPVALINSTGLLEFAINQGNASREVQAKEGDIVDLIIRNWQKL